jgi:drug/metabolite transporter (DMT)-like permease
VVESNRWRGVVMIVGAATCWGAMAAVIKLLFRERGVDPLLLVVIRAYLATLILFAGLAIIAPARLRISRVGLRAAALVGIGGLLTNNYLYFQAIHLTSVAMALLLQYQAPVLVAIYGALVNRQRVSFRLGLSLLLTVLGCALVVRIYDPAAIRLNLVGVLAGLGTAFSFAFYILTSRAALRSTGSWTLVAYGYLAASLAWLPVVPPWRILAADFPLETWGGFLAVATVGTVIPFGLFIGGLAHLPPAPASILAMLEPVVAAVAAYLILGETLLPLQILGGLLVLAGVVVVERS